MELVNSTIYKEIISYNKTYRRKDCFDISLQKYLIMYCDCILNTLQYLDETKKYCNLNMECIEPAIENFLKDYESILGQCPLECESTQYSFSISTSSSSSISEINDYIKYNFNYEMESNIKSVYRIFIYFNNLEYTELLELQKFPPLDLVSNIGGTLGLFLGISLLSFIEILEMIIHVLFIDERKKNINPDINQLVQS